MDHNQISPASTGLIIHIILALATFLACFHLGWKFYLLGFLLFLLAGLAAFDKSLLTTLLAMIVPVIIYGLYIEDQSFLPTLRVKKRSNKT